MVRLKVIQKSKEFQQNSNFNPNMVRLKECKKIKGTDKWEDFNPNMVRLKETLKSHNDNLASQFQSQYGSIKR